MTASALVLLVSKLVLLWSFVSVVDARAPQGYGHQLRKLEALKASIFRRDSIPPSPSPSPSLSPSSSPSSSSPRTIFLVTQFGADPTCQEDSTQAILDAVSAAVQGISRSSLIEGIADLGGVQVSLGGGCYRIRRPIQLPAAGVGNLMIVGGTIRASDDFPEDGYLIDLSASSSSNSAGYNFEYITMRDLMLDCNYRGGAISVVNSLRTSIDNCYITHFATTGIMVQSGHETYIRNSFLGQHITAGGDHAERNFSGTAINLMGNDNAVTDVVIFSASVGVMISGQANTLSGVHCYNKAAGFGGTGVYLKLPGLTQTRIVNCYMDFTGIVAEDPVQLDISNSFFLGDAYISLKSVNGVANGVTIVNNMFSGSDKGVEIVQLDGRFTRVGQVLVHGNNVRGMTMRSTVARASVQGNGTTWTVDFNPVLLFPNLIKHVQYSLSAAAGGFPNHALRNVSDNKVVVEADREVPASVFMTVDQGMPN